MNPLKKKSSKPVVTKVLTEDEKQEQLLNEAKQLVSQQGFMMKRALDANNINDALKHASHLISELRTNNLSPKTYYALYIFTVDQLRHLEIYISDGNHNKSLLELYAIVQYCGNILPRLYLLVTVGSALIKKMTAPAKDLLVDLVELCRGVQHPTRGLFLRTYLSEMTKDKLPDEGSKYEGTINDSIDFILVNFTEMNKLWVRMQHGFRQADKREQERAELNVLVGKNLSRLGQLDGLSIVVYKDTVLPRILSQILQCKDRIAQQNLMDVIIQAFSDEYHLITLPQLLTACLNLEPDVNIDIIIDSLLSRLANYYSQTSSAPKEVEMFQQFVTFLEEIITNRPTITLSSILIMINSLITVSLKCYKTNYIEYLEKLFNIALKNINKSDSKLAAYPQILKLLQTPAEVLKSIRPLLTLKNSYFRVLEALGAAEKFLFSKFVVNHMLSNDTEIPNVEEFELVIGLISPLLKPSDEIADWEDNCRMIGRVINLFYNSTDISSMFELIQKQKEYFTDPQKCQVEFKHTLGPLVFKSLQLIQFIYKQRSTDAKWDKKAKAVCKTTNELVTLIKSSKTVGKKDQSVAMLSFNLYLECSLQTGLCGLSNFAYGFFTQGAMLIFEEEAFFAESQYEYEAVQRMISITQAISCFDLENYEKLTKKLAQYSTKVLTSSPQSKEGSSVPSTAAGLLAQIRLSLLLTHLFKSEVLSNEEPQSVIKYNDIKTALTCLKRAMSSALALTTATGAGGAGGVGGAEEVVYVDGEAKGGILVELVDHFLYFYKNQPDLCEIKYVNGAIQRTLKVLTEANLASTSPPLLHLENIKQFVEIRRKYENLLLKKEERTESDDTVPVEDITKEFRETSEAKKEAERWKIVELETQT